MKLRTGDPWMSANDYGRSLIALTINLLVRDIEKALVFQREVLDAKVVYSDPDFAVVQAFGGEWMLHADHTYQGQVREGVVTGVARRGAGIELRLHGGDPDEAEAAARRLGFTVLAGAAAPGTGRAGGVLLGAAGSAWAPG